MLICTFLLIFFSFLIALVSSVDVVTVAVPAPGISIATSSVAVAASAATLSEASPSLAPDVHVARVAELIRPSSSIGVAPGSLLEDLSRSHRLRSLKSTFDRAFGQVTGMINVSHISLLHLFQ